MGKKSNSFGAYYRKSSFWAKIKRYATSAGREVIEKALTLYYCSVDPDTPAWAKTVIIGALGYFIVPLDAIPDVIPIAGYGDDLSGLASALAVVAVHVKPEHKKKAREKLTVWFG